MKIINVSNFDEVTDPVKTEETISAQLKQLSDQISDEYTYVSLPIAWSINNAGVQSTQKIIDKICHIGKSERLIFVCQHILVKELNFGNNLVFTPHATYLDSFIPIPHYSCNYDIELTRPWDERDYKFSFIGSFQTHPVRKKIYDTLSSLDGVLVEDTGHWHFYGDEESKRERSRRYAEILGNTKYSLCPRGTGPSTIRIWESMAMGSKPVLFSDSLKMPHVDGDLWKRIGESFDVDALFELCNDREYDNSQYFKTFSNEKLYKSVTSRLL